MAGFCSHFGRSFGGQNMSKSSLSSAVPPVISRRVKRWKFALPSFERSKSPGSRAVAILFIHKQLTEITCPWKYQTDKQTVLIVVQITPRSRSVFHVHSLIQDLSKSVNLCGRCGKYWRSVMCIKKLDSCIQGNNSHMFFGIHMVFEHTKHVWGVEWLKERINLQRND